MILSGKMSYLDTIIINAISDTLNSSLISRKIEHREVNFDGAEEEELLMHEQ